jgi:hypothetical protein
MQSYTEIPSSQSLQSSLALLLNNDKTTLSCSSGSAFPNTNIQVGMLCFRTDQLKLYILKDATPTWLMIADLNGSAGGVAELVADVLIRRQGGAEGGQFSLEKPATSTTLSGNVVVDLNGDKLRFFDALGTNKGFYIDLSTGAGNAATKIWHDANDGAGSGLDADLLDGMQTSSSGDRWGVVPFVDGTGVMEVGKSIDFHETDADAGDYTNRLTSAGTGVMQLNGVQIPVNNGQVQTNLNADMLDGFHSTSFVRSVGGVSPDAAGNVQANYVPLAGGTMTGNLTVSGTGSILLNTNGDIKCYRAGGTTGVLFLNSAADRYVYWDGAVYNMPGGNLMVNGAYALNAVGGALSRTNNTVSLNTVHSGGTFSAGVAGYMTFNGGTLNVGAGNYVSYLSIDAYGRVTGLGYGNPNCNCSCVPAGTKVRIKAGIKNVESVMIGDVVETTAGDAIVTNLWRPKLGDRKLWSINGVLSITGDHLIKTAGGWACVEPEAFAKRKEAGLAPDVEFVQLEVGAEIVTAAGLVKVESIEDTGADADTQLFTLYVSNAAEFYANDVVVDGMNTPE